MTKISRLLSSTYCLMSSSSQKGYSTGYIILFIIVIIFAVMLAGGGGSLFTGNEPSPDYSDDIVASPTASPSAAWGVTFQSTNCIKETVPQLEGIITATGPLNGYLTFEVQDGSEYKIITTSEFKSPKTTYDAILSSKDGFNSKKWRLNIFSGGNLSNEKWTGGKVHGNGFLGDPTGC